MGKRIKDFVWHYQKINEPRKYKLKPNKKKMIKELCSVLKERLQFQGDLPFVDVYAGLAQLATYKEQDENGNPITQKMPVSYHTNIDEGCVTSPEKALTPDSTKKGIIYFEENGGATQTKRLAGGFTMWTAQLILVGWFNRELITGDAYSEITSIAHTQIMAKLKKDDLTSPFTNIKVSDVRLRQDPSIFAKYTYDETVLQFLRPPFEYLAIDLSVRFILKGICLPTLEINPKIC